MKDFLRDKRAQVSMEYLLVIAGGIAIIAIAVFFTATLFRKQAVTTTADIQGLRDLSE